VRGAALKKPGSCQLPLSQMSMVTLNSVIKELYMIEPAKFALFISVSWALILSPGPDMIYVITRGMAHGRRAGILSAVGVVCGILVHTTAAAFGLTLILQTSAFAFLFVKFIGAAYLFYLGIKAWRDKSTFRLQAAASSTTSSTLFWQGVLSNVLNPKIAIFFLAFLPQFVDQTSTSITLQMVILGLTFACFGLCFLLVLGYSGSIGRWLTYRPHYAQFFQRVAGGILIGLGIRLALTEK
jgi:threonine/homoserine/homoserine lactone efflux protein